MAEPIYLGTQGWSYKSWVGSFYPPSTSASAFLGEYARHFQAVEVDSTYYGTPKVETVKQWYNSTPADFRFTAKFPRFITHEQMLQNIDREAAHFLATMHFLGEKLGPLLLQFPYQFKPDQFDTLAQFIEGLPREFRYAVEIRHRGWLNDRFFDLLAEHRIALALSDYSYMPRTEKVTSDFTYIRWLGSRRDVPDGEYENVRINRDKDLQRWSEFMARVSNEKVTIWGFANNHYQGHSPATIRALMERLGIKGRMPVQAPAMPPPSAPDQHERRSMPRVDATYRIAYECFNKRGIKVDEGPAKTVDISGRGALIEIPRGVDLDDSMVLLVMAPFHMLMVKGSVVHSRRMANGRYHVGVKLTEVIEGTWDVLDWVIRERLAEKAE